MFKPPRTLSDFRLLESLMRAGHDVKNIEMLFNKKTEWRSEVNTLAGILHCSHCKQSITLQECLNCGQTTIKEINS